jgi:hypothetical protein
MPLPYENATSGKAALGEIQSILRAFGVSSFGCMENFAKGTVVLQFEFHGRQIMVEASAKGYAALWLRHHPYGPRTRASKVDYERHALKIGETAIYSILRDWIKGQVTAVEVGMLSFEGAFLGQIMLPTGETILERIASTDMLQITGPAA